MNYEHWEYEPETRTVLATDIEDGITLVTVEPYDDADDIGRLIAAAPEMYRLLKEVLMLKEELIPTSDCGGILSFSREMKIRAVLACIDRKEEITPHEGTD